VYETGDTTSGDKQTLEALLDMSLRFACFIDKVFFFLVKNNTYGLWTAHLKFQIIGFPNYCTLVERNFAGQT